MVADNVQFLEPKSEGTGKGQSNRDHQYNRSQEQGYQDDPFSGGGTIDISDDNLPF